MWGEGEQYIEITFKMQARKCVWGKKYKEECEDVNNITVLKGCKQERRENEDQ